MPRGKGKKHSQYSTNNTEGREKYSIYVKSDLWKRFREMGGTIEGVSIAAENYISKHIKNK